jgi:hypothetical protein
MPTVRLTAQAAAEDRTVTFLAEFSAPQNGERPVCTPASLDTGDQQTIEVGSVCLSSAQNWRRQRQLRLANHTYRTPGTFKATLHMGANEATALVNGQIDRPQPVKERPTVKLFSVTPAVGQTQKTIVKLALDSLQPKQHVRIDGDAGNVHWLSGTHGSVVQGAWTLSYAKPGIYTVAVDLLDQDGFWLATLAEKSIEIGSTLTPPPTPVSKAAAPATTAKTRSLDVVQSTATATPWLPFRYVRPLWAWAQTYTQPASATVARALALGSYLAVRQEVESEGQIWLQTGSYDWIPASAVAPLQPSELRGAVLNQTAPPPAERSGVVTASVLNVRARPGVAADNPPIVTLSYGAVVAIYAEAPAPDGAIWFRIGESQWVHSNWIQITSTVAATPSSPSNVPQSELSVLPVGWVVTSSLNVRQRPGLDSAIVDAVYHNQPLAILETETVDGQQWLRIGDDRWIYGAWAGIARPVNRPATIGIYERWVGVNLRQQTAVAYEGDRPVYAALVATGLPNTPTVQGVFRTWQRLASTKMSGGTPGNAGYYSLEDVTWTCYFYSGYALHTAYWHDAFGRPRSHGCVNFSPYDAWWIFQWSAAGGANSPAVYVYTE